MKCDVLLVNAIGPAFTGETVRAEGIGGSELEVVQIAEALAANGHEVVVANGVAAPSKSHGVTYVPFLTCGPCECRALYIERGTSLANITQSIHADKIVVRATDIMCEHYEPHRKMLELGHATLIGVSEWQIQGFKQAIPGIQTLCIPPILGPLPAAERVPGRFVYMSAPCKGLEATVAKWRQLWGEHPEMHRCHLLLAMPGHAMGDAPALSAYEKEAGIEYVGVPTIEEYRRLIASAEGVFFVNTMQETFCCVAKFAERAGTRGHILCRDGLGGIPEGLISTAFLTTNEETFDRSFLQALGTPPIQPAHVADLSAEALVSKWEEALGLTESKADSPPMGPRPEDGLVQEPPLNQGDGDPFFGDFLNSLRSSITVGGSELGLGMTLFSLAVSIRAACCVEIGRYKGFSTLALAGACKFNTHGWKEPKAAQQRPDVNYEKHHEAKKRKVVSIEKTPDAEAKARIDAAGLSDFVEYLDAPSDKVILKGSAIDLLFIDGDHTYEGCKRDVARFVPQVRSGGYVVLHDYFGWYDGKKNGSPIKKVCDELEKQGVEHLLVDTGYASLMVFRKNAMADERAPVPVPPRADGLPTIGLVLLAKNEMPIVARALASCADWIDCKTVLVDTLSDDGTAELCEKLGAEVHVRPYAGSLAETRNEALALAEQRTDYMLIVDADDLIEGKRPDLSAGKDVYDLLIQDGNISYPRGQLVKSRIGARFVGCDKGCEMNVPHEYLERPGASYGGVVQGLTYKRLGGVRGVSGWQDQVGAKAKYLRHARDLERHHVEHPDHLRTVFYLGQSYRDAGEPRTAREWYRKRANAWNDEEGWFSQLRVGELTQELGEDPTEAYLHAYEMRRIRAEPLVNLAIWLRQDQRRRYELAYLYAKMAASLPLPDERLFLFPPIYQWGAKFELAIAAHLTGRHDEAVTLMQAVTALAPAEQRAQVHQALATFIAARDQAKKAA